MTTRFKTTSCLGYQLFTDSLKRLSLKDKIEINTINQYSYCIAKQDPEFKNALCNADILLPDGIGMTWASNFLNKQKVKKIAGADIHQFLLEKMNEVGGACFYLGASVKTLLTIQSILKEKYPNIRVGHYSPPYKASFSSKDSELMIQRVNEFNPDVLFIGMTAPKQEKWSHAHKNQLDVNVICSIGAVFDFYAGSVSRPGKIWIKMGLEWLGRLIKEPKRMWKRYLYYGTLFVYDILLKKIRPNKKYG